MNSQPSEPERSNSQGSFYIEEVSGGSVYQAAGDLHIESSPRETWQLTWPGPGQQISNLPARNFHFVGRDEQLAVLAGELDRGSIDTLVPARARQGLGGGGAAASADDG